MLSLLCACSSKEYKVSAPQLPQRVQLNEVQQFRFQNLYLESIRQRELGNKDTQFTLLQSAQAINPSAAEVLFDLSTLYHEMGGIMDSVSTLTGDSLLELAVRLEPHNNHYKEVLAQRYIRQYRLSDARTLYDQLYMAQPNEEKLTILKSLCEATGHFADAIYYTEQLERYQGVSEESTIEKYRLYSILGDNENAYRVIEDLCAQNPMDLKYRVLLGDLFLQSGYKEQALDVYHDVLTSEPDNPYAQLSMLAYYKTTKQDSLYNLSLRNVVLNPNTQNDARSEALLGYMRIGLAERDTMRALPLVREVLDSVSVDKDLVEIIDGYLQLQSLPTDTMKVYFQQLLRAEPDYDNARLWLLTAAVQQEDYEAILKVAGDGILYTPDKPIYYFYKALALTDMENKTEALETVQRGLEQYEGSESDEAFGELFALAGDLQHEKGNNDMAFANYEQAIKLLGEEVSICNNYAYFLAVEGKNLERAEQLSKHTIDAEPQNPTYLDTYAWILYKMERYEEAAIYIDQTLLQTQVAQKEADSTVLEHAGDIYFRLHQTSEALRYWREAVKKSDDLTQIRSLKRKIKRRSL
ncbi:MAG: hypothetical protein IJ816_03830 [Alloprevotella sp.]|nr:hypothetical protein [Alloprevotella sp.]